MIYLSPLREDEDGERGRGERNALERMNCFLFELRHNKIEYCFSSWAIEGCREKWRRIRSSSNNNRGIGGMSRMRIRPEAGVGAGSEVGGAAGGGAAGETRGAAVAAGAAAAAAAAGGSRSSSRSSISRMMIRP